MLHNIFRRKKSRKRKSAPKVIVDIHEKSSLVPASLYELGADVEIRHLKVGDYQIGKTVIERKTSSDLVSSMINKRLIQQLKHLQQAKQPILIIEGDLETVRGGNFNTNALRGLILSITLNQQIPIIFTNDSEETATYLLLLAKQQLKPNERISLHSRIPKKRKEQQLYILEAFPNVGPKKAVTLLKKFKTLDKVFAASEEELEPILKSRSREFKSLLG